MFDVMICQKRDILHSSRFVPSAAAHTALFLFTGNATTHYTYSLFNVPYPCSLHM